MIALVKGYFYLELEYYYYDITFLFVIFLIQVNRASLHYWERGLKNEYLKWLKATK